MKESKNQNETPSVKPGAESVQSEISSGVMPSAAGALPPPPLNIQAKMQVGSPEGPFDQEADKNGEGVGNFIQSIGFGSPTEEVRPSIIPAPFIQRQVSTRTSMGEKKASPQTQEQIQFAKDSAQFSNQHTEQTIHAYNCGCGTCQIKSEKPLQQKKDLSPVQFHPLTQEDSDHEGGCGCGVCQRKTLAGNKPVQRFIPLPLVGVIHQFTVAIQLTEELVRYARESGSLLPETFIRETMGNWQDREEIRTIVQEISTQPSTDEINAAIEAGTPGALRAVERIFILNPDTSSLDLLPPEQRDRYRDFDWHRLDYPGRNTGDTAGPNERRASRMRRDLTALLPERRPNSADDGAEVVGRREFSSNARLRQFVTDQLENIPAFPGPLPGETTPPVQAGGHRLNRHALASFNAMRDEASGEGVPLIVISSFRSTEVAARRAQQSGNSSAVASFSSHSLGLAVDLRMSFGRQRYSETTTTPMQNVVDMRESPVHKWMFMHGASHGWYAYHNEPWHWEYNPEGFQQTFREGLDQEQQ